MGNPSGLTHFMLLSFAYTRFVRPLFGFSRSLSPAHMMSRPPKLGSCTAPTLQTLQRPDPRTKCADGRDPSGLLPLSRCLFGHSMAGPLFGPISGAVRCHRSGMAYANRLSLAAPGPGPLAWGRWHKPRPPPGLPYGLPWGGHAGRLGGLSMY
jgi:hypothetical protein